MPTPADNLRINGERLWSTIHEIAEIGPGVRGGSNRQTLTDADRDGRLLFKRWCEDAGLSVGVDSMGTMFARRMALSIRSYGGGQSVHAHDFHQIVLPVLGAMDIKVGLFRLDEAMQPSGA